MNNNPEKAPSEYWANKQKIVILDPDGWDRENYKQSWAEEITELEFNSRVMKSTVMIPTRS